MARTPRITDAQIAEALRKSNGYISYAAKMLGVSHTAVSKRIRKSEKLQEVLEEKRAEMIEFAESKLFELVEKGDTRAIIFVLKTLGKDLGWTERQEVQCRNVSVSVEIQPEESELIKKIVQKTQEILQKDQ